jgi:hypothetical protein
VLVQLLHPALRRTLPPATALGTTIFPASGLVFLSSSSPPPFRLRAPPWFDPHSVPTSPPLGNDKSCLRHCRHHHAHTRYRCRSTPSFASWTLTLLNPHASLLPCDLVHLHPASATLLLRIAFHRIAFHRIAFHRIAFHRFLLLFSIASRPLRARPSGPPLPSALCACRPHSPFRPMANDALRRPAVPHLSPVSPPPPFLTPRFNLYFPQFVRHAVPVLRFLDRAVTQHADHLCLLLLLRSCIAFRRFFHYLRSLCVLCALAPLAPPAPPLRSARAVLHSPFPPFRTTPSTF